jgi:3-methyladenine DNA glycosylase AlkD
MNDEEVLAWLKDHGSPSVLSDMGPKYGIHTSNAFGVSMAKMKVLAKEIGKNHELAERLWESGCYEARMVASMIDEPAAVTPDQIDRWCRDFDNWAICDTVCFNLFDRTPYAWSKVDQWAGDSGEFVKRTAFALLWSLALHDKKADNEQFVHGLSLIEREANDDRHLVSKSMLMAVRAIAKRRPTLTTATIEMTRRLTVSEHAVSRRLGKTALRELTRR